MQDGLGSLAQESDVFASVTTHRSMTYLFWPPWKRQVSAPAQETGTVLEQKRKRGRKEINDPGHGQQRPRFVTELLSTAAPCWLLIHKLAVRKTHLQIRVGGGDCGLGGGDPRGRRDSRSSGGSLTSTYNF